MRGAIQAAGVAPAQIVEVLDRSHAVARLYEITDVPCWPQPARVRWTLRARVLLRQGRTEELEATCLELAVGRHATRIKRLTNYFVAHRERMRYGTFDRPAAARQRGGRVDDRAGGQSSAQGMRQVLDMEARGAHAAAQLLRDRSARRAVDLCVGASLRLVNGRDRPASTRLAGHGGMTSPFCDCTRA